MTTSAARDVLAERQRQIEVEGWTPEHDDKHDLGELAEAAACYAFQSTENYRHFASNVPDEWPWDDKWWKPTNPRRDLVKAAALLLAEIERLDRCSGEDVG